MGDITIPCVHCGRPFIWSTGEQEFYHEHGLQPPKHCKVCLSQRRIERDQGSRGLSGPPAARIALNASADTAPAEEPSVPRISMPLWRSLRRAHVMRLISQFAHLAPVTTPTLDLETFSLLMQWMFEQFERETLFAEALPACLDLRLRDLVEQREEFAHIYTGYQAGPPDSILDVLDRLAGSQASQIYLWTFSSLTPHQREVGRQAPMAVDILEGQALNARLQDAQQRFRSRLERAGPLVAPGAMPPLGAQATGEISGQARPYYSKR